MNTSYIDVLKGHHERNKEILNQTYCKLCGKDYPHPEALIMHHRESHGNGRFKL